MTRRGHLTPDRIAEIRDLAAQGARAREIERIMGVTRKTVLRHARDLIAPYQPPETDTARLRRIIAAAETAEYGAGPDLARRFGLAHRSSFWGMVIYARRKLSKVQTRQAA